MYTTSSSPLSPNSTDFIPPSTIVFPPQNEDLFFDFCDDFFYRSLLSEEQLSSPLIRGLLKQLFEAGYRIHTSIFVSGSNYQYWPLLKGPNGLCSYYGPFLHLSEWSQFFAPTLEEYLRGQLRLHEMKIASKAILAMGPPTDSPGLSLKVEAKPQLLSDLRWEGIFTEKPSKMLNAWPAKDFVGTELFVFDQGYLITKDKTIVLTTAGLNLMPQISTSPLRDLLLYHEITSTPCQLPLKKRLVLNDIPLIQELLPYLNALSNHEPPAAAHKTDRITSKASNTNSFYDTHKRKKGRTKKPHRRCFIDSWKLKKSRW